MPRQSISFTKPNDDWLKQQIKSEEYTSKSELINSLIRKAREHEKEIEFIRAKLIRSEESVLQQGFTNKNPDEILKGFKAKKII
ncbi:ribbon-helix-helix domain-containing protein [Aquimarina algiphila]|uniref:CopG family transcriptional regulator n=1 Tax=Aquimarina algiphila TaxID=2047982 RepID=A0A554VF97_9FLAO|nr:type II toxin-antitoxin system ParD family antitoxin [Aquimarina algiphila]TSE05823.1 CopG family transcriptional regulator [Aquimarina algiphila]